MHLLKNPYFLLASFCYLTNRFLFKLIGFQDVVVPYLNDLLCLPVALTLALFLQHQLFPGVARNRLNKAQVIFSFLYFSVFFEGILPAFSERYTRDLWDIPAYAAGGILFYYFCNPKAQTLPKEVKYTL